MSYFNYWFRWCMFIPGGLVAGFAAAMVVALVFGLAEFMAMGEMHIVGAGLIGAAAHGYLPVSIGAKIAPARKKEIPALIVALIVIAAAVAEGCIVLGDRGWDLRVHLKDFTIIVVAALTATIIGHQDRRG